MAEVFRRDVVDTWASWPAKLTSFDAGQAHERPCAQYNHGGEEISAISLPLDLVLLSRPAGMLLLPNNNARRCGEHVQSRTHTSRFDAVLVRSMGCFRGDHLRFTLGSIVVSLADHMTKYVIDICIAS